MECTEPKACNDRVIAHEKLHARYKEKFDRNDDEHNDFREMQQRIWTHMETTDNKILQVLQEILKRPRDEDAKEMVKLAKTNGALWAFLASLLLLFFGFVAKVLFNA